MDSSKEEMFAMVLLTQRKQKRKRMHTMWVRQHFTVRNIRGEYHRTFMNLMDNPDEELFFNYMRMSYRSYDDLKRLVLPRLQPIGCNSRSPISGEEELVLAIRYMATGGSFSSLVAPFHMSRVSISRHVLATCEVLWDILQPLELPKPTEDGWILNVKRFGDLWDYPFAAGAIDGKHIALLNPHHSGSLFYNYKDYPSIVLMAVTDADSCFTLIDCDQYGRVSDAGVFQASRISQLLQDKGLNIPKDNHSISTSETPIPYLIDGDEAFPLRTYLMHQFAATTLNHDRRIYNYRHSRARCASECTFRHLGQKV